MAFLTLVVAMSTTWEALYEQYLADPDSVSDEWRSYFDQLPRSEGSASHDVPLSPTRDQFYQLGREILPQAL